MSFREREREAAEFTPERLTLREALAMLLGVWNTFAAARTSDDAGYIGSYLPAMRRACLSALVALELEPAPVSFRAALQSVFIALHDYQLGVVAPGEPEEKLHEALTALSKLNPLSTASGTDAGQHPLDAHEVASESPAPGAGSATE